MKTSTISARKFLAVLTTFSFVVFALFMQGCNKDENDLQAKNKKGGNGGGGNPPPPPPPPAFYFTNCNMNPQYSATLVQGVAANVQIVKNYINGPGGSYPAFTSANVNGVTVSAPAGTFNVGAGAVTFTITGTPVNTGFFNVWIGVGNIQQCMMFFMVVNAPASGPNADPGTTAGSTGVVNFTYKGQSVAYKTVRAKDGKIWLQQNLGSPQVAMHKNDFASYGDFFQWGRWDDGHQSPNSPTITGGPSLMNPSNIPSGNPNFIVGTTTGTQWWSSGGLITDTWSGTTVSSTNGKDPCAALGAGWHTPSAAEWQAVSISEDLFGATAAFMSNLMLTSSGYRDGGYIWNNGDAGFYWTGSADNNGNAKVFSFDDNTYNATVTPSPRGTGYNCRCVKN